MLKTIKGKEKYEKFHELKGMGDFQHNTKVLWSGGVLAVWRRPTIGMVVDYCSYLPCEQFVI